MRSLGSFADNAPARGASLYRSEVQWWEEDNYRRTRGDNREQRQRAEYLERPSQRKRKSSGSRGREDSRERGRQRTRYKHGHRPPAEYYEHEQPRHRRPW